MKLRGSHVASGAPTSIPAVPPRLNSPSWACDLVSPGAQSATGSQAWEQSQAHSRTLPRLSGPAAAGSSRSASSLHAQGFHRRASLRNQAIMGEMRVWFPSHLVCDGKYLLRMHLQCLLEGAMSPHVREGGFEVVELGSTVHSVLTGRTSTCPQPYS